MKKDNFSRLLEIIPGLLTWSAFILTIIFSFSRPTAVAIFILIFDMYWLYRSIRLSINTIRAYRMMQKEAKIDWREKVKEPSNNKFAFENLEQVILLIFYKEPLEIIEASVKSYVEAKYPRERLILVLATEERAKEQAEKICAVIKQKYSHYFREIIQTIHPANLPGEIKCKSSNATWAAKQVKKYLDEQQISYDRVIIHNFDADTRVRPDYFHYVAYKYLKTPSDQPVSFQPIHIYSNNIWDAPAPIRVVAQSSTLIFMHNTLREKKFHHFSSRSDIFQTIVDIGYWTVDSIPEDSREYFDSFFYYQGRLKIEPLYIPLEMNAVLADSFTKTIINQYQQLRRWAWGIVDFSYVVKKSRQDKKIAWLKKLFEIFNLLESHFSWATSAIFITFLGWIPTYSNSQFSQTVLGSNLPFFSRIILLCALIGMMTSIILSFLLLPKRPKIVSKSKYSAFFLQWFLVPFVSIFLSSMAAIDAQTRLMFGRYLEYQVSEKTAIKH